MIIVLTMICLIVFCTPPTEELYDEDSYASPIYGSFTIGVVCAMIAMPLMTFNKVAVRALSHIDTFTLMVNQFRYLLPIMLSWVLIYAIFCFDEF